MPSGHSSGGGHFSGGGFSHSGGHFSSSRSSSIGGGHFNGIRGGISHPRPYRPWYSPRVVVFGGRQVYLGSGRASTISVLGVLIIIAIIATVCLGFGWLGVNDDIKTIQADYVKYRAMAEYAYENPAYTVNAVVYDDEQYDFSGKYCIFYRFQAADGSSIEGYSFYVYNYEDLSTLRANGVTLALNQEYALSDEDVDSIPLDYRLAVLEEDAEYNDKINTRKGLQVATPILAGVSALLILSNILVRATAKKATEEQIAADKETANTNGINHSSTQSAPSGTWRCAYCNTLNDNEKERCDGCGAKRQN